jgi:hypothetical protein
LLNNLYISTIITDYAYYVYDETKGLYRVSFVSFSF